MTMNGCKTDSINLDTWDKVSEFLDAGFWQPSPTFFEHVIQHKNLYPTDAFSKGQLASKSWLLKVLYSVIPEEFKKPATKKVSYSVIPNVTILGSWIGTLVEPLHKNFNLERIYGIDLDADSIEKSEKLNQQYVQDGWKYKGVVSDVSMIDCSNMQFETSGELITVKPDWIINTSCEHMDTGWFDTVDTDQLIIMQTNNSEEFDGHINPCYTLEDMQAKYPLSNQLYIGEMITPAYTRYMQIGYK